MLLFFKHLFGDGSYTGDMQHFDILLSYSQTILNNLPKLKISYGVLKKCSLLIGPEVKKKTKVHKRIYDFLPLGKLSNIKDLVTLPMLQSLADFLHFFMLAPRHLFLMNFSTDSYSTFSILVW